MDVVGDVDVVSVVVWLVETVCVCDVVSDVDVVGEVDVVAVEV